MYTVELNDFSKVPDYFSIFEHRKYGGHFLLASEKTPHIFPELADFEHMPNGPQIDYTVLEKDGFDTEHPLFICYVAEINKNLIGYAIAYYTYSTWCGKAMYLEDLYITPNYREKHIGSKLLKAIAKEAVNNNCCRLDFSVLEWNPACNFYKYKGATDMTIVEGWHHYRFSDTALKILAADP
ncbi:unnamed protein product [Xylocopa violacea]|uniref:N-acetyltransferase domain-containing protein n=1 Tax=Xylocopa violacea TaxID=135666 RepID=A0ABP1ND75_XYLVO